MRDFACQLTPPGSAGIAVLRLGGPRVGEFLRVHFSRQTQSGKCVHGEIRDGDRVLDDAVVVLGEEHVDLNVHGGPWVVRSVLELARAAGFEVTEHLAAPLPMEVVEGEMALEREVMASLPLAGTELALRTLLGQVEAWEGVAKLTTQERESMAADEELWWLLHPPRVAIAGAANVGKSTLANQLFARERSITADLPGTTRDWVGEIANLDGLAVMLVDTPGIRETTDSIEAAAILRASAELREADLVVLVLDGTRPLEGEQASLVARFDDALIVVNKSDLPSEWVMERAVSLCARSGAGVDKLRGAIRGRFGVGRRAGAKWWTTGQRDALRSEGAINSCFSGSS